MVNSVIIKFNTIGMYIHMCTCFADVFIMNNLWMFL